MGVEKQVFQKLSHLRNQKTVAVTIGNVLKGDDGAGPAVCEKLKGRLSAELVDTGSAPENYIQPIVSKAPDNLIIIDAVDFGGSPGQVKLFEIEQLGKITVSTHTLSPHLFVDMIKAQSDVDVYFIGIQPAHTAIGQPMSPCVAKAVEQLADTLSDCFPLD